jgi:hypothetical protein
MSERVAAAFRPFLPEPGLAAAMAGADVTEP